jgi:hypothetical protein
MPTVLRRSGPDIWRNGKATTPRAMIHTCETCGFEGAAFGIHTGSKLLSFCGWRNGAPVCVGKAKSEAA